MSAPTELPPVPIPFRWTTRNREFHGKVFFAASAEEFVAHAFATIDAVTSLTGRAEIELQARSWRRCDFERFQDWWCPLPGPLLRLHGEGDPVPERPTVWPNEMGRLEEELYALAETVWAEAVTFYAPQPLPPGDLAAPGDSADFVLPIDTK